MNDSFHSLRLKMEEREDDYRSFKKKTDQSLFAYEYRQKAINKQKELWEEVLRFYKGTDSERLVYHRLEIKEY